MGELALATVFAASDNTVPLYTVSGMLVVALGYMLRDRRDTDKRVDVATAARLADSHAERDRARESEEKAWAAAERFEAQRDDALERNRILQVRLLSEGKDAS